MRASLTPKQAKILMAAAAYVAKASELEAKGELPMTVSEEAELAVDQLLAGDGWNDDKALACRMGEDMMNAALDRLDVETN